MPLDELLEALKRRRADLRLQVDEIDDLEATLQTAIGHLHHVLNEPPALNRATAAGEAARDWLAKVGLASRLTHYPHQLSGGEQQRVALARALAARPILLFADEPTGNLDSRNAGSVADLMFALVAECGAALVMVTHDTVLAERADRIVRMADGKVEVAA